MKTAVLIGFSTFGLTPVRHPKIGIFKIEAGGARGLADR
jgi:hypothetical protein